MNGMRLTQIIIQFKLNTAAICFQMLLRRVLIRSTSAECNYFLNYLTHQSL